MALFVYRRWHVRHADRRIRMDRTDRGCDLSRDRGRCSLLALTLNFGEHCRIDDPINGQRKPPAADHRSVAAAARASVSGSAAAARLSAVAGTGRVAAQVASPAVESAVDPERACGGRPYHIPASQGETPLDPPVADLASSRRGSPSSWRFTQAHRSQRQAVHAAPPRPAGEL
jgi:hypothetical protein